MVTLFYCDLFMLNAVGLQQVQSGPVSKPLKITADAAPAISSAINRFDSSIERGMCWYHMSVNFREKLKELVDSHSASTNNALESHNRVIKGDILRQRAPLDQFIEKFMKLTTFWSLEQKFGAPKEYVATVLIHPRLWTEALNIRDKFPLNSIP